MSNSAAGCSVALVPDVSGDLRADVIIGAKYQGSAYLVTSEAL